MKRIIAGYLAITLAIQPLAAVAFANAGAGATAGTAAGGIAGTAGNSGTASAATGTAGAGGAAVPAAMTTLRHGLSWLSTSLKSSIQAAGGSMSAEAAASHLAGSGASQAQANTIIQSEIAAGTVQAPAQPQGFWSRIRAFGQQTGAHAQMSANKAASVVDFKPYTEVQLNSGTKLRWSPTQTNTYQIQGQNGEVLNRTVSRANPDVKSIKIEGPVDPRAFSRYQGQLTEARSLIDISRSELSGLKLKVQSGQGSAADAARIKALETDIPKYEKSYKALEKETKLMNPNSSIKEFAGNAARFALTSVGIRAGINVLSQAVQGQDVDLGKAFGFMSETSFWTGTAGSFIGSMLFSSIGNAILPGSGALMRVLPGFLGAAAGYEFGSGNADRTNWNQLIASTVASAAAFAFIGGPIGIGASILAGMVVNKMFESEPDLGMQEIPDYNPEWSQLAAPSATQPMPEMPVALEMPQPRATPSVQALPGGAIPQAQVQQAPALPTANPKDLNAAVQEMQARYRDYMNAMKNRDAAKAREQYELYKAAQQKLQVLRGEFAGQ